jgi:uncharacterized protein YndB with AHSA1/START domain
VIPVQLETFISAPRDDVFALVADMAGRVAWTDHFQSEYHLAHPRSFGAGAAARYRTDAPFRKQVFSEMTVREFDRPRRIVERGKQGRLNRSLVQITWDFFQDGPHLTRVTVEMKTEPWLRFEAIAESLGSHRYFNRQWGIALERLRMIFEERPEGELARATIAAYEPLKAARYG